MANGTDETPPPSEGSAEDLVAEDPQVETPEPGEPVSMIQPDPNDQDGDGNEFAKHTVEYWTHAGQEARKAYYLQIDTLYEKILDEFFQQSNSSAVEYRTYSKRHLQTRRRMVISTGILALLNVVVAYTASVQGDGNETPLLSIAYSGIALLPLFGALYASALTVYSGLESLYGYSGRAQAFREVRELFLNAARECELDWIVNVRPFAYTAPACVNAAVAYERLVKKDIEVRGQAKELIESRVERAARDPGV